MTITVNTDASFYHQTKDAGYAFYIKCNLFTTKYSGKFKSIPKDNHQAEQMAIANAIASLAKHAGVDKMKFLVINTNSRYAIERFENPKTELDFYVKGLLALLVTRTKAKYKLKHVVAHNGTSDSRSWVNDWCDKQAKKESRSSTGIGIAEVKMGDGPWNRFTLKPWLYRNKSKNKYEFKAKGYIFFTRS